MTVKEFWEKIDSIDIDSREDGRYTEDEMYDIGCTFITLNNAEKREIGGWDKLVEILKPLDKNGQIMTKGDTFRQWIKGRRYAKDEMIHNEHMLSGKTIDGISFDEFEEKTNELKESLYKQQVKTSDRMNALRRVLREEARLEDFKEVMKQCASNLGPISTSYRYEHLDTEEQSETEAVMLLSDLHIGVQVDNFYNTYNVEIAKKRMDKFVCDTIQYCLRNNVRRLNVINLGDLVHGTIHTNARLEQEVDVVEQIMTASEIVADALNKLQKAAPEVIYRSCTDNHSRAVANLHESIESENYGKLIDFYLKARLEGTGIIFAEDNIDQEIGLFELLNGDKVAFAHGHHDSYNQSFQVYCGMTQQFIKYICLGHYHSKKVKSFMGAKVIVNGSVCGTEQYAFSKRLFGDPEQTLMIFDGINVIDYHINLNIK